MTPKYQSFFFFKTTLVGNPRETNFILSCFLNQRRECNSALILRIAGSTKDCDSLDGQRGKQDRWPPHLAAPPWCCILPSPSAAVLGTYPVAWTLGQLREASAVDLRFLDMFQVLSV